MARSKKNLQALRKRKQEKMTQSIITPTESQPITTFDYADLSPDVATLAKEAAIEIKFRERAIYENIIEIGNRLIAVKNALPHGKFLEWIEREFGWSDRYARQYIKIAEEIKPNRKSSSDLPNSMCALYALASGLAKADDEETKQEIMQKVEEKTEAKGKPLTEKEIKEITKNYLDKIETLESQVNQLNFTLDEISEEKKTIESNYEQLREQYADLEKKESKYLTAIADNETELKTLDKKIAEAKKEAKKEVYEKEKEQLEREKLLLSKMIDNLKDEKKNIESNLGFLRQVQDDTIRKVLAEFERLEKKMTGGKAALVMPPTPNLLNEYHLTIKKLRAWADVLETTANQVQFFDAESEVINDE